MINGPTGTRAAGHYLHLPGYRRGRRHRQPVVYSKDALVLKIVWKAPQLTSSKIFSWRYSTSFVYFLFPKPEYHIPQSRDDHCCCLPDLGRWYLHVCYLMNEWMDTQTKEWMNEWEKGNRHTVPAFKGFAVRSSRCFCSEQLRNNPSSLFLAELNFFFSIFCPPDPKQKIPSIQVLFPRTLIAHNWAWGSRQNGESKQSWQCAGKGWWWDMWREEQMPRLTKGRDWQQGKNSNKMLLIHSQTMKHQPYSLVGSSILEGPHCLKFYHLSSCLYPLAKAA